MDDSRPPLSPPLGVKLRSVPAAQGAQWVKQGLRVALRQPLGFAGLYGTVMFGSMLLMNIPVLGMLLVVTLTPSFTLIFMRAVQAATSGQRVSLKVLIDTWQAAAPSRITQLKLGMLYATCVALVLVVLTAITADDPALRSLVEGSVEARQAALQNPVVQQTLIRTVLIGLLLYVPASLAFWHAPALVQWAGQSVGKAVFFSIMACWHNRWAFTLFGLTWGAVIGLVGVLAAILAAALGAPQALELAMLPIGVLFGAGFYASLHYSIVDCFEHKAGTERG